MDKRKQEMNTSDLLKSIKAKIATSSYSEKSRELILSHVFTLLLAQSSLKLVLYDVRVPGEYAAKKLVQIRGEYISLGGAVPVIITVSLKYPHSAPYIVVNPPEGKIMAEVSYLNGIEIMIDYLKNWNSASSTLYNLHLVLTKTILAQSPYVASAIPVARTDLYPRPEIKAAELYPSISPPESSPMFEASVTAVKYIELIKSKLSKVSEEYMKKVSETLSEIGKCTPVLDANAKDCKAKKKLYTEKIEEMKKALQEIEDSKRNGGKAKKSELDKEITKENALKFLKPSNVFQEKWVVEECKRLAADECLIRVKKAFESGSIDIQAYLDAVRKISSKQFLSIYKKSKCEDRFKQHKLASPK